MTRCKLLISDAGPINSLWVANSLDLLLKIDMDIVIVDAMFDEMTSDPTWRKDQEVKAFIETHQPPFSIVTTDTGQAERKRRERGEEPKSNAGEVAIADFMTSYDGLDSWIAAGDPVVVLSEDMRAMRRIFLPEPHVHALGTIGFLKGLERSGLVPSSDAILIQMRTPSAPGRRPQDARTFSEPAEGLDRPAMTGSMWTPHSTSLAQATPPRDQTKSSSDDDLLDW